MINSSSGVWDTDAAQTLYFFIDVKTSSHETFQAVLDALSPLREKGYLTTLKGNSTLTSGAITIIGTGNTPLDMVGPVADRDYFFDGPLDSLDKPEYKEITRLISPIASADFKSVVGELHSDEDPVLDDDQLKAIRSQIDVAKERGIGARYWDTPPWPIRQRDLVWRALLKEEVALLNVDDLDAVTKLF